jgi:hypothetical protein
MSIRFSLAPLQISFGGCSANAFQSCHPATGPRVTSLISQPSSTAINAEEAMEQGGTIELSARNELLSAGSILTLKAGKYVHLSIKERV